MPDVVGSLEESVGLVTSMPEEHSVHGDGVAVDVISGGVHLHLVLLHVVHGVGETRSSPVTVSDCLGTVRMVHLVVVLDVPDLSVFLLSDDP